ncbi:putative DsbA family dithiol-disulfide isomerase [Virgibacillus halotolerans]|uniref:DsbA family protein n=1 Tax=Virgibacillus halotolerans TaxID=1071053 RepID=UPI00195FB031|nr:DsbA family protein [Virgibacillus halotolerans]MBM7599635.1 putative DsbA family dithiol-disulfide isomerase [Virgibacillus halotolerans]
MNNNKMICDMETGICGEAGESTMETIDLSKPKKTIDLYYVTDPICSHCWALEPVFRRFQKQYGHYFTAHTVLGGLLENWDGFADVKNGISGPSDVAEHWREVGVHSRMPIDGSLWYDNPVESSFIPSRVFKVIQKQDEQLANHFLRKAREAVFAFNQNIGDENVLTAIVNQIGLDGANIVEEASQSSAQELLNEDFTLAGQLGARGFPTIIMVNEENKGVKIVGARSLQDYENGLKQVLDLKEDLQAHELPALAALFEKEDLLFSREIEELYDIQPKEVKDFIQKGLSSDHYEQKEILDESYIEKI